MPATERYDFFVALVRSNALSVLGESPAGVVEDDKAFREAGFDSLTGVELRNRLVAVTGVRLPATVVFDHPTPQALAEFLTGELGPAREAPATPLEELERLEAALARAPRDEALGVQLKERLRKILAAWSRPAEGEAAPGFADELEAADADAVLNLIDGKFGRRN
ncbi:acyl carrier protein [Streptomyces iranensis]